MTPDQDVGTLICIAGFAVAGVVTHIYDHAADGPRKKKLAKFAAGLWKAAKIAIWIAIGVPTALLTLLICIVWPPMLIAVAVVLFFTIHWLLRNEPMPPRTASADFITPLVIGVVIGSSIHHDR